MKKVSFTSLVLGLIAISSPLTASADLIDAWDFAGLAATTASTATPASINATIGSGVLDVSAFGLGSPQGTSPERTSFSGSTINAFSGGETGTGTALALANSSANGKSLIFSFSMSGYQDLSLSFATRGTATGFDIGTWSWSTDGINYTTLAGVNTATRSTTFTLQTVDFSSISALDNAQNAYLEYTLSDATSSGGNNRIDNVQLNATVVPEPSTLALAAVAGLLLAAGARRRG
jgi:hypothetical protein